jgi:hypothetical protein
MDELEPAVPMLEESIELARLADDPIQIAATLSALARILVFHRPADPRIPALLREALELSATLGERLQTVEALELVAHFAMNLGKPTTGAELIGAADAERARAGADRKPDERPYFEQTAAELAQALGSETYEHARMHGHSIGLDDAVARALSFTVDSAAPGASAALPSPYRDLAGPRQDVGHDNGKCSRDAPGLGAASR